MKDSKTVKCAVEWQLLKTGQIKEPFSRDFLYKKDSFFVHFYKQIRNKILNDKK